MAPGSWKRFISPGNKKARSVLNWSGAVLSVACLGYVIWIALDQGRIVNFSGLSSGMLFTLTAMSLVYGFSLLFLALSWALIVKRESGAEGLRLEIMSNYCVTQLAKYLPTNVMHYISRHVSLSWHGENQTVLGKALACETFIVIIAAASLAGAGLTFTGLANLIVPLIPFEASYGFITSLYWICLVSFVLCAGYFLKKILNLQVAAHAFSFALTFLFFTVMAAIFFMLNAYITGSWTWQVFFILPAAWLAGFMVPGSPAGIGIREVALLTMLAPLGSESEALLVAALFRLVTVCGDILCFGLGHLLRAQQRSKTEAVL